MQISAPSLYSGSRLNTSVRIVAPGSVALTAVMIMALFRRSSFTRTLTTITSVHTVPRRSVPPGAVRHQAVQAVEGYRGGTVGEADRRPR